MKKLFIPVLFIVLFSLQLCAVPCDSIVPMNNREFVPVLVDMINNSQKNIKVLIYTARYYEKYENSINDKIYNALIDATNRGVDVEIIIDVSTWNKGNTEKNIVFTDWIKEQSKGKIRILYDPGIATSHNKIVLIDGYISIVGSMNWSYYALEINKEASVAVFSKPVYNEFLRYYDEVKLRSTKEPELK